MTKLMRNRWLRWSLLLGVLAALGVGIYEVQPPAPRCVIDAGRGLPNRFTNAGRLLVTLPRHGGWNDLMQRGPLKIWDTHTGTEVASFFANKKIATHTFSDDGRYCAAVVCDLPARELGVPFRELDAGTFLIDLVTGKTIKLDTGDTSYDRMFPFFSPNGDVVAVWPDDGLATFESATGRPLAKFGRGRNLKSSWAFFAGDLILVGSTEEKSLPSLELWNPRDGKLIARLDDVELVGWHVVDELRGWHAVDDRFIIARRVSKPGAPADQWLICNSRNLHIEAEFQVKGANAALHRPPGGQHILLDWRDDKNPSEDVEIRELPTGKLIGKQTARTTMLSPDGRRLFVFAAPGLKMFELPSMKLLWSNEENASPSDMRFTGDSRTAYVKQNDPLALRILDAQTGTLRGRIDFPTGVPHANNQSAVLNADGRSLLMHQDVYETKPTPFWAPLAKWIPWLDRLPMNRNDLTIVLDTDTCRERFRLTGWDAQFPLLSPDGNTLVTVHNEPDNRLVLRCWDVDAWKPLRWPIGVPAGLGALVALFAWWRGWRRPKPVKEGGTPCPS